MIRCNTYRLSIAPMLDRTDRHYRAMVRQITKHTMLYTEMVTTGAILFGEHDTHLKFHEMEHPVALQLGGDDPDALRACARIAEDYGYDEININVGCPSNRVQNGNFGACLMSQPNRVAECVAAICNEVSVPVTVKHRIGIDHNDSYDFMANFVDTVAPAGVRAFIVHARIAWLQGLSPKENRTVPPLRYHDVHRLKRDFPDLKIVLNGGITTLDDGQDHLRHVDGVMIGRAAYENPMMFSKADSSFFGAHGSETSPQDVVRAMLPYVD